MFLKNITPMYKQGLSLFVQLTYDDEGRITSYGTVKNGELDQNNTSYYKYDEKGQLVRVDENKDSTQTYTYDSHGNIKKINHYAYTRGEITENAQCEVNKFKYEEADPWPDKLSGIENGLNEIVYDENGNPISLDDTTVSWTNGRQLESFNVTDENGNEVPFLYYTYDDKGIRTSKTYGDTTTYYTNIDGNVTAQYQLDENGNIINLTEFIYDSSDNVIDFTYEGETYFYLKNLQNDVLAVIDSNGVITYRGYYRDEEASFYYLQSRYYDPSICRFISSDFPEYVQIQKDDYAGINLFTYCGNDPINYKDPSGCSAAIIGISASYIALLAEALAGIIYGIGSAIASIKTAIATSPAPAICFAAITVAIAAITYVLKKSSDLEKPASKTRSAVKKKNKKWWQSICKR